MTDILLLLTMFLMLLTSLMLTPSPPPAGGRPAGLLWGGSGRGPGLGGQGGPRRRRPTQAQLRANSRLLNPDFLSEQDLYEFTRLSPQQFAVSFDPPFFPTLHPSHSPTVGHSPTLAQRCPLAKF